MLDVSPPVLPESTATLTGAQEYERIVGIECRTPQSSTPSSAVPLNTERNGPWQTELLIASWDGVNTKLFAVACSFTSSGGSERGEKRLLMSLCDRRDIIQASCSELGPQKETIISFTERKLASSLTKRDSGMSRGTDGAVPINPTSPYTPAGSLHEHVVWLHAINTDEFKDVTVRDPLPAGAAPTATRSEHQCQYGYMLRRKPSSKGGMYWLRACDYTVSGLQFKEIAFKKGKLEVKSVLEWNLAQMQLFHHWDPFTQRLTYLIDRPPDDLRIVRFFGHPEERRCEFNYVSRMKRPLYPGRPRALPWCTATSSNNASFHYTILPIRYEDDHDYAVCRQYLPTQDVHGGGASSRQVGKVICEITLLRNLFDRVDVDIELERPVPVQHCRVAFLFVHGMIAIYLPGVFVHYVDVHHKDLEPRYLFGVSLKGVWSQPVSPRNTKSGTSPSTAQFSHAVGGQSIPTNASSGSANSNSRSPLGSHFAASSTPRDVVVLPIPSGNWIATPDTTNIRHVGITKAALWEYIADRLSSLSCSHTISHSIPREESLILQHALHVVTAHFHFDGGSSRCNSSISLHPSAQNAPISGNTGEDHFVYHLRDLVQKHWKEVKPAFFTQLLLGEAYRATRTLSRASGNLYYQFLSMTDDRYQHQLMDDIKSSKESHQRLRARSVAGGGGGQQSQQFAPSSPRSTAAPLMGGSSSAVFDDQMPPVNSGCGGHVRAFSFRATDAKQKESSTSNTGDDWWIVRGIKLNFSIMGFFRGNQTLMIKRIPIADARQLFSSKVGSQQSSPTATPDVTKNLNGSNNSTNNSATKSGSAGLNPSAGGVGAHLHDIIKHRLEVVGVPDVKAHQIGVYYEQEVTRLIEDITQVITRKGKDELPARVQFYLLNHLILAVHSIGQRLTSDLAERFAQLAASSLPQVVVLAGIKSALYTPSVSVLDSSYSDIHDHILRAGIRYGQKLSDRDYAKALKTPRVPFTVASPQMLDFVRVRECGGCPSIYLSAAANGGRELELEADAHPSPIKSPSTRSEMVDTFAAVGNSSKILSELAHQTASLGSRENSSYRVGDSRKPARYHSVPSGSQSTRYLPAMPTLDVFHKWTATNCVSTASETDTNAKDAKEFVMCAYELGPTLQCYAKRTLPKDAVTQQNGGSLNHFAPWARWNSSRLPTPPTPPPRAASLLGGAPAVLPAGPSGAPYLHTSDTMRRERARDAMQYAFVPFASAGNV